MGSIDTALLKRDHPIEEVVSGYGIELKQSGRTLVGRCPFHADGGRPNLHIYPASQSWYCFRCAIGGDAISFVRRIEGLGFRDAVARIVGGQHTLVKGSPHRAARRRRRSGHAAEMAAAERACLAAAVELYQNRLLTEPAALSYLEERGLGRATIECCRIGYVGGDELTDYLRWRGLPVQAAIRVGLLSRGGRELMAGRIVVPEIRGGQPIWLIGRTVGPAVDRPKYMGLPGRKPLMGWEVVSAGRTVWLVEGVFDWLTLRSWGFPALALTGTHVSSDAIRALTRFERLYLALDNDEAGRAATDRLIQSLGDRAVPVALPGVKDVAEFTLRTNGRNSFKELLGRQQLEVAA